MKFLARQSKSNERTGMTQEEVLAYLRGDSEPDVHKFLRQFRLKGEKTAETAPLTVQPAS